MVKVSLYVVGKIKEKFFTDAINEYSKRLSAYCNLNIVEVADEMTKDGASAKEIAEVKASEGKKLLAKIPQDAYVCALCIDGKMLDSEEIADKILSKPLMQHSHIAFVIGGSLGLSDEVISRADIKLSFGKVTYPHQLMRVILLEQVYRGFKIKSGEPYHK